MIAKHIYTDTFFDYIEKGSISSARVVIPAIMQALDINSIVDVGCGRGAWLRVWKEKIDDVHGIDGDYVNRANLLIEADEFSPVDLTAPFHLSKKYDLSTCFEVAEHLNPASSDRFISSLCALSDVVAFSAAVPGQGGENHINERPLEFWRRRFAANGYECFDCIRPRLVSARTVMPWYRNNILLYANSDGQRRLGSAALEHRVPQNISLREGGSLSWRARRALVRCLPRAVVTAIAQANGARIARKAVREASAT